MKKHAFLFIFVFISLFSFGQDPSFITTPIPKTEAGTTFYEVIHDSLGWEIEATLALLESSNKNLVFIGEGKNILPMIKQDSAGKDLRVIRAGEDWIKMPTEMYYVYHPELKPKPQPEKPELDINSLFWEKNAETVIVGGVIAIAVILFLVMYILDKRTNLLDIIAGLEHEVGTTQKTLGTLQRSLALKESALEKANEKPFFLLAENQGKIGLPTYNVKKPDLFLTYSADMLMMALAMSSDLTIGDFGGGEVFKRKIQQEVGGLLLCTNGSLTEALYPAGETFYLLKTEIQGEKSLILFDQLFKPIFVEEGTILLDEDKYEIEIEGYGLYTDQMKDGLALLHNMSKTTDELMIHANRAQQQAGEPSLKNASFRKVMIGNTAGWEAEGICYDDVARSVVFFGRIHLHDNGEVNFSTERAPASAEVTLVASNDGGEIIFPAE